MSKCFWSHNYWLITTVQQRENLQLVFAYLDIRYPDLSVNFMAARNPYILKRKFGCCGCLQILCKLCSWYCGGTSNYSKIISHASEEWMVITLVSQTRSKESLLTYFLYKIQIQIQQLFLLRPLSTWITYVTLSIVCSALFPFHRMSVPIYSFIHSNIKLYNKVKWPALTANCKNDTRFRKKF